MKTFLLALSLISTHSALAAIESSTLEARHQKVIEQAIEKNCGYFRELTEVETNSEVIVIDQGIRDVKFTTELTGLQRLDQNIFDRYTIIVESEYSDMYDHASKDWGVFSVSKVNCSMN